MPRPHQTGQPTRKTTIGHAGSLANQLSRLAGLVRPGTRGCAGGAPPELPVPFWRARSRAVVTIGSSSHCLPRGRFAGFGRLVLAAGTPQRRLGLRRAGGAPASTVRRSARRLRRDTAEVDRGAVLISLPPSQDVVPEARQQAARLVVPEARKIAVREARGSGGHPTGPAESRRRDTRRAGGAPVGTAAPGAGPCRRRAG